VAKAPGPLSRPDPRRAVGRWRARVRGVAAQTTAGVAGLWGLVRERVCRLADRLLEPLHHHATTPMFAADLLPAAGDGEIIGLLLGNVEQACQVLDPAEHRPLVVDATGARARVEVDAPAVWPHHGQVLLLLLRRERFEGFVALTRIQAAAGAATADAAPVQFLTHGSPPRCCDNPSQWRCCRTWRPPVAP
jgi:hypothetical protein